MNELAKRVVRDIRFIENEGQGYTIMGIHLNENDVLNICYDLAEMVTHLDFQEIKDHGRICGYLVCPDEAVVEGSYWIERG